MSVARQNTLCLLLRAVQGRETIVELRNEAIAKGIVEEVDYAMNISMKDVVFTRPNGQTALFPSLYVHGRQVRYVHIPDDIDMVRAIREQMEIAIAQRWKKRHQDEGKTKRSRRFREKLSQQTQAQAPDT